MAYTKTTWANSPAGTSFISATNLNKMETGIFNNDANIELLQTGWNSAGETWEYVSVDDPTGVFRVNADVTTKYSAGMRVKFTNGGNIIFGIITVVGAYTGGYTPITFLHEIDPSDSLALYLMANSAITVNYYSNMKAPYGFPLNINKWSIIKYNGEALQTNPTQNAWYNIGTKTLVVPIGVWKTRYETPVGEYVAATADHFIYISLSTANNSESDTFMTSFVRGNAIQYFSAVVTKSKEISITTKTTYYLIEKTGTASVQGIEVAKNSQTLMIAECAYL